MTALIILLLLIKPLSFFCNNTNSPYTSIEAIIAKTLAQLATTITTISNQVTSANLDKCHLKLLEYNKQGANRVLEMINNSSQNTFDIGNYRQCIKNDDYFYYLLTYDELFNNNRSYLYLNQSTYLFGICIAKECNDLISEFASHQANFESHFQLSTFTFITTHKDAQYERTLLILVIFIIILSIFGIKVIFSLFYNCCLNNPIRRKKKKKKPSIEGLVAVVDEDDEDGSEYQEEVGYYQSSNKDSNQRESTGTERTSLDSNSNLLAFQPKTSIEIMQQKKFLQKQIMKQHWISFVNIVANLKDVSSVKNNYYNEKKIQFLALIREAVLFFYVYHQHFLVSLQLPTRNKYKDDYYLLSKMVLLKLSSYALNVWVSLEGFECSFKLMMYLKKNLSNLSFKTYLKFYILFLPKCITFYLLFFFLHYGFRGLQSYSFFNPPLLSHLIQLSNNCSCMTESWKIFTFWDWFADRNPSNANHLCFTLGNLFYNTHFCFIFVLLFMYLSFRLRKKLFDLLLFLLYFSLFVSSYFMCSERYTQYNLFYVLGENCSIQLPHVFLIDYLSGVFGGVMYFYFIDIINSNSIKEEIDYNPLWYCNTLMRNFYRLPLKAKRILMIVLLFLLFFMSFIFGFASPMELTRSLAVFAHYEKKLFNLMLVVVILFFQTKEISIVKYLYEIKIFTLMSRISFTYLCTVTPMIYIYYTGFTMELNMNSYDLFFMTCGITFMLFIINLLIYLCIEQPIKLLIKIIKEYDNAKDIEKLE